MPEYIVAALYKFTPLPDYEILVESLKNLCAAYQIKGTLLLAREGINGTIAGSRRGIDALLRYLQEDGRFADMEWKESSAAAQPFNRLKVRAKKESVTLGLPEVDPTRQVGIYIKPEEWNSLISDPEVIVIDVRNNYECAIGAFQQAVNPETDTFSQFPTYVSQNLNPKLHKKVAMYCTGGIRCEKASSYMVSQGFKEVYQLKGGILKYLETVKPEESLWKGECFVFDNRVTLQHGLKAGSYELCHGCRNPISAQDKESLKYIEGIVCPHCFDGASAKKIRRAADRHRQMSQMKDQNRPS